MATADRLAAETIAGATLMEAAGQAVADASLRHLGARAPARIVVLCGPGNNGGDGFVAARLLQTAGCEVSVATLVPLESLKGDAADAAARWAGSVVDAAEVHFDNADLVVDALFGAGLTRDIEGAAAALIARVNHWATTTGKPILAVDVPSGVDGGTGHVRGVAIEARESITFFRLKPGHILMPGRLHCGTLSLADIGISPAVLDTIRPTTRLNAPALWSSALPIPSLAGHKYGRGHAVVLSGPIAHTGAARLAARGALRAGAGLVTVATSAAALLVNACNLTSIMTNVCEDAAGLRDLLADPRKNVAVLGPGLGVGAPTRDVVQAALGVEAKDRVPRSFGLVLDADALMSFAEARDALFAAIEASRHAVVLTPHDGEFARLFGQIADAADAKPARTRAAAKASHAVVLLKGPDTVVAHPDGRVSIAASDAPWLATAGSGDVLAGIIAGLLAQGMPAFEAASAAVWIHAEAARRFGPGLISEDIPEMLPAVFRDLFASA